MLSHRTLYLHALALLGDFCLQGHQCGAAHHPLVSRQWLGTSAEHHHEWRASSHGPPLRAIPVLRLIQEEKATGMTLVPTMANALLNCPDLGKFDTSSMKVITTGRRGVLARVDRPPGAGVPLRGMLRLRSHRNLLP